MDMKKLANLTLQLNGLLFSIAAVLFGFGIHPDIILLFFLPALIFLTGSIIALFYLMMALPFIFVIQFLKKI